MSIKVLIVIPSYNEEEALPALLNDLKKTIAGLPYAVTPLVINDCSKDNTSFIARKNQVKVLDLINNLGIGGAVQTGLKYANENNFDYAIQMDGDGQHPPAEVEKLIKTAIEKNVDVVIGSRFLIKEGFQSSLIRRIGIKYFYRVNRLLTGNRIFDSTSGFRLLGKKAIAIAAKYYPDDYPEPESLVLFAKAGLKIAEMPVVMHPRLGGKSSISGFASVYYWIKVTLSMLYTYVRRPQTN